MPVITLKTPVEDVDGTLIHSFTFRPARWEEILENPPPFERIPLDGGFYEARNNAALKDWVKKLLVEPLNKHLPMKMTDPRDVAAVEALIRSFFIPPDGEEPSGILSASPAPSALEPPASPAPAFIG